MELTLSPLAGKSCVSGKAFEAGSRVVSYLARGPEGFLRHDLLFEEDAGFTPDGPVLCRWAHTYKPRAAEENPDRALRMGAEALFLHLCAPGTEVDRASLSLVQFLAMMLERKRVLKLRGESGDGLRHRYEHMKSRQMVEVEKGDFGPGFFNSVKTQLGVLVGEPRKKPAPPAAPPPEPESEPPQSC